MTSRHFMKSSRLWAIAVSAVALALPGPVSGVPALADGGVPAEPGHCAPGTRTLSHFGDHVYPDTGNGGYTSLHTGIHMVYDASANQFLPGNYVVLTDRATQCLTSFSLDFERTSANTADGPDMKVGSVTVNGRPAKYTFVQPTYPGDPKGQNDPDPAAHEISQLSRVGGPDNNPLPPACSPELPDTSADPNSQNGQQCPANKLVITPSAPLRDGSAFVVTVSYTGRPGVHNDGDGTTEGWFRSDSPAGDGGFVTTEPVGTEDWMPLNDHPSAKPAYDFYDTVSAGRTVIANGELISRHANPPDATFPEGSVTWHWHSPAPIASYLVENSVGSYDLTERTADNGVMYYEAQASSLSPARKQANLAVMNQQQDITEFQAQFNGTYPFTSNGVVVGIPSVSFDEEMQTMIAFSGGQIGLRTLNHENMHQWWGDNVSEANYNLTFFKEGFATFGEYLMVARNAETAAGGPYSAAGQAAFDSSLIARFNTNYANTGSLWAAAPSDPTPFTLFSGATTYVRPGTAYIALRQILGKTAFAKALQQIQRDYGGRSITENRLEAVFHRWMPNQSAACGKRLDQFFTQWFDTVYPPGGGVNRPQITGPGLDGPGFYNAGGGCG
ncbi:MAG: M1 family aminopeptidase [Micromonosporaceae bacterium]